MISVTKELTKSDVSSHQCRLMLGKEVAESQILCHWSDEEKARVLDGEGHRVLVYDLDTATPHHMTLKRNKSYILNNNWSAEFVQRRELKAGDQIGLHWNTSHNCLVFSVLFRNFLT